MRILLQGTIKRNVHWDSKLYMKNVSFVDWHNIEVLVVAYDKMGWKWIENWWFKIIRMSEHSSTSSGFEIAPQIRKQF